jgi:threonine/homoserine/homoserine lactone efflux protein
MVTLFGILLSSFVIALSGALMPGPLLTVAIGESTRQGFWAGPLLILGHAILELLLVVALMVGLAPILQLDTVFGVIALTGAFILLWMAFGMLRSLPTLTIDLSSGTSRGSHLVLSGIVLSLANPYWSIWWATIGLGYILHSQRFGLPGVLFFFTGHILADLAWYSVVTYSVTKGRALFSDRIYRKLMGACACFLILFAGYFGYSGWEKIFWL